MKPVALLGGSFNPPHLGHLMAAQYALATHEVEQVWFVPTYKHAFEEKRNAILFEDRLEMCHLLTQDHSKMWVSTAEEEVAQHEEPNVGRTWTLLEWLRKTALDPKRFFLVVGSDILSETHRWYRWDDIRATTPLIVVPRGGYEANEGFVLPKLSSTEIRMKIRNGEPIEHLVGRRVADYIKRERLYLP